MEDRPDLRRCLALDHVSNLLARCFEEPLDVEEVCGFDEIVEGVLGEVVDELAVPLGQRLLLRCRSVDAAAAGTIVRGIVGRARIGGGGGGGGAVLDHRGEGSGVDVG